MTRSLSPAAQALARVANPERKCGCGCGEIVGWGEWAYSDDCEDRILADIHADEAIDREREDA